MISVVELLKRVREEDATLRALTTDRKPIRVTLEHDPAPQNRSWPELRLSVSARGSSDVTACVPLEIEEVLTVANGSELLRLVDALIRITQSSRGMASESARIYDLTLKDCTIESDFGSARKATLTWDVTASWRASA